MTCSQTKKVLRVFVEINLQTAKHLTRLMGVTFKKGSYRLSKCLTKAVLPCKGPPDTSHYVYPYPSSQCLGELGYSSVHQGMNNKKGLCR